MQIGRKRMFISGQIGLIPKNMTLPTPSSIALEMALSLQHAERIAVLTMDTLGTSSRSQRVDSAIFWMTDASVIQVVRAAWKNITRVSVAERAYYD